MNSSIPRLEKILSIKMKNASLLSRALTHKSANQQFNNERLEFLGDRVIGLILANELVDLYPEKTEGDLDKRLAKLVNRKTCASIARTNGIKNFIIRAEPKKKIILMKEKILSDTCEAVIGAVYIDRGYNYVKKFVLRLWKKEIKESHITIIDSKTKLQEYSLKLYKKLPIYSLLSLKGPKHNLFFKMSVSIFGSKQFIGTGNSKKKAEQEAAKNLLKNLNNK